MASYYDAADADGRAIGRRYPQEFDRDRADDLLPLVPEDGAELRESHPWRGITRKPTNRPFKVHVANVGADFALCGVPVADDGPVRPLLPGSLCRSCAVHLYTRRHDRKAREEGDRERERFKVMTENEVFSELVELRRERDYLLSLLRSHGLILPGPGEEDTP